MWTLQLIHLKMSHMLDSLPIQACMKSPLYHVAIFITIVQVCHFLSYFIKIVICFQKNRFEVYYYYDVAFMSAFLFVWGLLLIIMLVVFLIWRSHVHSGKLVVNSENKSQEMSAITNPMSEHLCAYIYSNEYSYLAFIHIKEW